jgi:hypothetical protein
MCLPQMNESDEVEHLIRYYLRPTNQGRQIFIGTIYVPKRKKIYQNDSKILQTLKFTQTGIFGLEICHLTTLLLHTYVLTVSCH